MSKALPTRPRSLSHQTSISIVAAQYNEEYTDALVENTHEELTEIASHANINLIRVPGAFEVPVAVETLIREEKPDCVIALGLIIRGQTAHGDMIGESVTHALQQIAIKHAIPVIHEVILVSDEKQAYARCIGSKLNRGREAARSAVNIINTFHQIKRPTTRVFPSNA
ncbi:MAG: 6,7-dimethyl-8-ribityllumazine synthase [Verrucomicrobiae bacterium]|nr:6,7-dimethyl-8-ribityllumazine synthase [Verrucomicrobiae bacterium]NNJ44113.1 6,7-dimethyl-8-ribityllumazine synthase [Akkermansiaceae bacterium]